MQAFLLQRPGFVQTTVVSLLTLAALTLLSLVLAYWTWNWFAPRLEPSAPLVAGQSARVSSGYGVFGKAQRERGGAAQAASPIRLLGVVAAAGGSHGYAVMQLESREIRAVREGEDIASGIRLAEVHPDRVILSRNGVRESLAWPQKDAGKIRQAENIK